MSVCVVLSHIPAMTVTIPLSTANPGPSLDPAERMYSNVHRFDVFFYIYRK